MLHGYDFSFLQNRTTESLSHFDSIFNDKWFKGIPMVLVFTMVDLFREKLKSVPLSNCFAEYQGSSLLSARLFLRSGGSLVMKVAVIFKLPWIL